MVKPPRPVRSLVLAYYINVSGSLNKLLSTPLPSQIKCAFMRPCATLQTGNKMGKEFELTLTGNAETGQGFIAATPKGKGSTFCMRSLSAAIPEIDALDKMVTSAMKHLQGRSLDGYTGKAFAFEAATQVERLKPSLSYAITTVQAKQSRHIMRWLEMLRFNIDAQPNQFLRSDFRSWFMSHDIPKRIKLMNNAEYGLAVSVLEGGQTLAGVDDSIWKVFLDHTVALIHINKAGLDNDFRQKPSESNLTKLGVDQNAMLESAAAAVKHFYAEAGLLTLAEDYLQSVVRALMLVSNKSFEEVVS